MKVSKKWLAEYVELPEISDRELAERLTLSTVEVEEFVSMIEAMKHIVVGKTLTCEKHPGADRLKVCSVDVGLPEPVQIVCGGANIAAGMTIVAALPGSRVRWHGEGDLIELAETKIRGEKSFGMICASGEIGLKPLPTEGDHDIRDLGNLNAKPGTPLAEALGMDDVIFDIDNKSLTNRPDLVGHVGMAREIAALYRTRFTAPKPAAVKGGKGVSPEVRVEDTSACPRYMGVAIEGLEIGPSPEWLQARLASVGVRSINNIVDVTNYVMLEVGQPLHAFDLETLGGDTPKIVVRRATEGEKLVTLDEVERELDPSMLLITDGEKPLALAGIMGGMGSGVSDTTTRVFLESAYFDPIVVRKTSQVLSLRSESSMRYEKSLDPTLTELGLARAVELFKTLHPNAKVISSVVDVLASLPEPLTLPLTDRFLADRLGADISVGEVEDILERLGFETKRKKDGWSVTIPSFRATKDVRLPEDVLEEISRIWGYERIPAVLPTFQITPPIQSPIRKLTRTFRAELSKRFAATEAYLYAFTRPATLEALGYNPENHIRLANPLSDERPYLTSSLIPNLLEVVRDNERAQDRILVFHTDRVFLKDTSGEEDGGEGTLPAQPQHLALAYAARGEDQPFAEVRRIVMELLTCAGYEVEVRVPPAPFAWMHATRCAEILVEGVAIGSLAEVDPDVANTFGLERRTAIAELSLDLLVRVSATDRLYQTIPSYPDAKRDIACVVDESLVFGELELALRKASPLLVSLELFDVYRGKGIPEGKKSLAFHLTFRAADKTLSSEEADLERAKIVTVIEKNFGGTIRA